MPPTTRVRTRYLRSFLPVLFLVLASFSGFPVQTADAQGEFIRVPDDYPTIAQAMVVTMVGDPVAVRAGTYTSDFPFSPRSGVVVLGGYDGTFTLRDPDVYETILAPNDRIIECSSYVNASAILDGFTLSGGASGYGGLARVTNASPTFRNNRFLAANSERGGAIYLDHSGSLLTGNHFENNHSAEVGGAIAIFSSSYVTISGCSFANNTAAVSGGAIFLNESHDVLIEACVFAENLCIYNGGAVLIQHSGVDVVDCVLYRNSADKGGGIGVYSNAGLFEIGGSTLVDNMASTRGGGILVEIGDAAISRCIVTGSTGGGVYRITSAGAVAATCDDVWSNDQDYVGMVAGAGCFSADPLFCGAAEDNYRIFPDSPCAPENSPTSCGLIGALSICSFQFLRVPSDFAFIQNAIDAAEFGDTVAVATGTYLERLNITSGLHLLGGWDSEFTERDPVAHPTIIDAEEAGSVIVIHGTEADLCVIDGFVITGGTGTAGFGGGIDCLVASSEIRNNIIIANTAAQGAAISCRRGSRAKIRGNLIVDNVATGIPGGAIYTGSSPLIHSNTFDANQGPAAAGIAAQFSARPEIRLNIVVNGLVGVGIYADEGAQPITGCNDVWSNQGGDYFGVLPGPDALSLDPLFCPGEERFLHEDSPCAAGQAPPACGLIGARGVSCAPTGILVGSPELPASWLGPAIPNPMNPAAWFNMQLADGGEIRLRVIDVAGRHVRTLVDELRSPGSYRVQWNGRNDAGNPVSSGIYFCRLTENRRTVGESRIIVLR